MSRRGSVVKGAVAGAVGGLLASWIMNQFQAAWSRVSSRIQPDGEAGSSQEQDQAEDATMKTAGALGKVFLGRELLREEKQKAAPIVHYAFGTFVGAIYGAASEKSPEVRTGFGLPFGTAVFIGADEIAVPALGLAAQSPLETSISDHVYAFASHLAYGASTELIRRCFRRQLR